MKPLKKIAFVRWLLVAIFSYLAWSGVAQTRDENDLPEKLKPILDAGSKNGWHWFVEGIEFDPSAPEKFFDKYRDEFELEQGYGMKLVSQREEKELGMNHFRFQQTYNGIPITGAEYLLHLRDGKSLKGNGRIVRAFRNGETPSVTGEEAIKRVLEQSKNTKYAWEDPGMEKMIKSQKGKDATFYPQPNLVYYSASDKRDDAGSYQLAFEFKIFAMEPMSHIQYYVSAKDGSVIKTLNRIHDVNTPASGLTVYNGVKNFTTDFNGSVYALRETNRSGSGTPIITLDSNNGTDYNMAADFQNGSTNWQSEPVGTQGHWSAEKTFDYFYTVHGRNSFDNSGTEVRSYLEFDMNYNNAFWNGFFMTFGGGNGTTRTSWASLDVVAHEFTHGVTEFSAGLIYENESGALNESFSDIFGTVIEFYGEGQMTADWLVSEDVTVNGAGIRSMSNPNTHSDPDTYQGQFWEFTSNDYGGVHTNSGVQNHWFYLLTLGGSGVNDKGQSFTVTGIGMDKAAAIAYRNLTEYLTLDSRYRDAREGALSAAEDLYGRTSMEYAQVAMAWYAVGVGFPVSAGEDLSLRSVFVSGASCNQLAIELVNLSTIATIPAGAVVDVVIRENGVARPMVQIVLASALPPGSGVTRNLNIQVVSANGRVDVEGQIAYAPDPEPGNNVAIARIMRGVMTIGGTGADFTTVVQAATALRDPSVVICGHLVFKIRSGTYTGEIRLESVRSTSSEHTATFESETGNPIDVTLRSNINFNSAYGTLTIENTNGIRFRNVTIIRQATPSLHTAIGVAIRNEVADFVLEGSRVRCLGISGPSRTNIDFQPFGATQQNITIKRNLLDLADDGISFLGDMSTCTNIFIEYNTLNSHQRAIRISGQTVRVKKNKIVSSVAKTGIEASASSLSVEGNELVLTNNSASIVGIIFPSKANGRARFVNNMISLRSGMSSTGINIGNMLVSEILHNSVRLEKISPGVDANTSAFNISATITLNVVMNNIIFSTVNSSLGINASSANINAINFNDYHIPNGRVGRLDAMSHTTLAQWQAATGFDANSKAIMPSFISANDLRLATNQSGLRGGTNLYGHDIDGEMRSQPDYFGADHYHYPSDFGVGAIRLVGPGASCNKSVQIDVFNASVTAGFAAGTQIPVSYTVNGTTTVREALSLQQNLLAGQIATYTFSEHLNAAGNFTLAATTDIPDANPGNNGMSISVNTNSVYTIGGVDPDFATIQEAVSFVSNNLAFCDPNIVLRVRPGVYPEEVMIGNIAGATSLTLESETGNPEDVVITASVSSTISLRRVRNVTIRNVTIRYSGISSQEAAISITSLCENIGFANCIFSRTAPGAGRYLITQGLDDLNPEVNGLFIVNSAFQNGGIRLVDNQPGEPVFQNIQVDGNDFQSFYDNAVHIINTRNVSVLGNTMSSANTSNGVLIRRAKENISVENNQIRIDRAAFGIEIYSNYFPPMPVSIVNNFIDLKSGAGQFGGISIYGATGNIIHNTVRLAAGPVNSFPVACGAAYGTAVQIKNNIFSSVAPNAIGIMSYDVSFTTAIDYNDIHMPNGYTGSFNQEDFYQTLAQWRAASGYDIHSTNVAPSFVGATDLHLTAPQPALRAGVATSFMYDIDGELRGSSPYMGADELPATTATFPEAGESDGVLALYPNPVKGEAMTLNGRVGTTGTYYITIHNSYGVIEQKQKLELEAGDASAELDISSLAPGIYLLRVTDPARHVLTFRFEKR